MKAPSTKDNLKAIRASGMTQAKISKIAGISQPSLSKWESGKAPRSADAAVVIDRLAREIKNKKAA